MARGGAGILGAAVLASAVAAAQPAASPVQVWLVDPHGEVDGVLLRDGRSFHFAPTLARKLTLAVRIGDPVRIEVVAGRRVFVNERDAARYEISPAPAPGTGSRAQPALQRLTARGHITAFVRVSEGAITGFLLNTGEQVRVPASLGPRLASLRLDDLVTVEGLGNRGRYGVGMMALTIVGARGQIVLRR
jgi:hypothetical protein